MRCPICQVAELDDFGRCYTCDPRQGPPPSGIDLAALTNPEHAAMVRAIKEQLLIVFLKRLGGRVAVPVSEVDNTEGDNLGIRLDPASRIFHFEIIRSPR